MKKAFLIIIGTFLLASCMVNTPDYSEPLVNTMQTTETNEETPAQENEPATQPAETPEEEPAPEPEEPTPGTTTRGITLSEPAPEETEETPVVAETRTINWRDFYTRVEQKGREKYNGRLPWGDLSRDAHIGMGSWMVDAGSCSRCPPSETVIRKIAQVLEVTYEWLIYG